MLYYFTNYYLFDIKYFKDLYLNFINILLIQEKILNFLISKHN